jgi:hypothetical protein
VIYFIIINLTALNERADPVTSYSWFKSLINQQEFDLSEDLEGSILFIMIIELNIHTRGSFAAGGKALRGRKRQAGQHSWMSWKFTVV